MFEEQRAFPPRSSKNETSLEFSKGDSIQLKFILTASLPSTLLNNLPRAFTFDNIECIA